MGKTTMISLVCNATGMEESFEVGHAERILAIRDSGWALPEGSDYELGEDGSISRRDKKKVAGKGQE
jgi:hypothetical protein